MAFKMKGHTLPGPKQRKEVDHSIINVAPKKYETQNGVEAFKDTNMKDGRPASSAFTQKTISALKQTSDHEKMYELEEELSYIQEDLDEDPNNKALLDKKKELEAEIDKVHATLEGGNIKPGYTDGERDVSKDVKYP